jgi:hypothetical protein
MGPWVGLSAISALLALGLEAGNGLAVARQRTTIQKDGRSPWLVAQVAVGSASLTVHAEGRPLDGLVVAELIDPQGRALVVPGPAHSPNPVAPQLFGSAGVLVPNGPGVELLPGAYRFRIAGRKVGAPVAVQVVVKARGSARVVLPVDFHFAGRLRAANAPTDAGFQSALEAFRAIFTAAGVEVVARNLTDVPAASGPIEIQRAAELFRAAPSGDALNVFLVEALVAGAVGLGGRIDGLAGGIPGPALAAGAPSNGVAVSEGQLSGLSLAHEAAHYLGLFHVAESGNLMHDGLPGRELTPQQAAVLRGHPLVRDATQWVAR